MKKYHFFVRPCFNGWIILERGIGANFFVSFPTKYRSQLVAKWLCKLWENHSLNLETLKKLICHPYYRDDWKRLKNLMFAYNV